MWDQRVKRCNRCGIEKSVEGFYRNKRSSDGLQGYCKQCDKIRRETPDRMEAKKHSAWLSQLKKYGIGESDYNQMFSAQMGLCLICQKPEVDIKLAVDHDHTTGKVRGLLCKRCNMAICLLDDDSSIVTRAALYLNGSK